jgi:hypothetical protein
MRIHPMMLVALAVAVAGCEKKHPEEERIATAAEAMPDLLLPAKSSFVSKSGSPDALSIVLRTPIPIEQVADFYRTELSKAPWKLEADSKDNTGAITLYGSRKGPPLWVRLWVDTLYNATAVQLTGAAVKDVELKPGQQIAPGTGSRP